MLKGLKINFWLLGILALVFILRLPSFFEPHWYGDEEIYLVLAQMMRRGAVLYRDIWDNKTPLLYAIYAISPTLFWAKLSATICVLGTTLATYFLSKRIFSQRVAAYSLLATALTGVLLSLTVFEGTIANAELYFTLPIILGAWFLHKYVSPSRWPPVAGILVGLFVAFAFLLKVPAVLDFVGLFVAVFVIKFAEKRGFKQFVIGQIRFYFPILLTFSVFLLLVVSYFFFNRALSDFLTAAFSQNASYVAVDSGPFSKLSNPLFIKAFWLSLSCLFLLILFWKKRISNELLILGFWFGFSLYGALLSNRPYMHYLLQAVPPAVLLTIYLISNLRRFWPVFVPLLTTYYLLVTSFRGAFALEPKSYYGNFFDYISERKSQEQFFNYFDGRTQSFLDAANFVKERTGPSDPIFVWGDVSSIYVVSERSAATRFIQAHHLTTIPPVNFDLIMARLEKFQPKFILVSRPVHFAFPKLEVFLKKNYRAVTVFENLYVYQNQLAANHQRWTPTH